MANAYTPKNQVIVDSYKADFIAHNFTDEEAEKAAVALMRIRDGLKSSNEDKTSRNIKALKDILVAKGYAEVDAAETIKAIIKEKLAAEFAKAAAKHEAKQLEDIEYVKKEKIGSVFNTVLDYDGYLKMTSEERKEHWLDFLVRTSNISKDEVEKMMAALSELK